MCVSIIYFGQEMILGNDPLQYIKTFLSLMFVIAKVSNAC